MANSLRSADQAYYRSKTPLNFHATREGVKNSTAMPSYRQRLGDTTVSSDKYYASIQAAVVPTVAKVVKPQLVKLKIDAQPILPRVVAAFGEGATRLELYGDAEQVRLARSVVDMAVGRNTLTRDQADVVIFIVVASVIEPPLTTGSTSNVAIEAVAAVSQIEAMTEEEALLSPPKVKKSKRKSKKKYEAVANVGEAITEADVAAAFGVLVEEGDD